MLKKRWTRMTLRKSHKPGKKYDAVFTNSETKKQKVVSFGAAGMSDYTKHKDAERKKRYTRRHKANENWNVPDTPGSLSRWILWNKPSLRDSLASYKKKFGFDA
jgi:hypothetical protein